MQIELSQSEMELLQDALECWEKDAMSGATLGAVLGAILTPKEGRQQEELRREEEHRKAKEETQRRKQRSLMLRAKLAQCMVNRLIEQ